MTANLRLSWGLLSSQKTAPRCFKYRILSSVSFSSILASDPLDWYLYELIKSCPDLPDYMVPSFGFDISEFEPVQPCFRTCITNHYYGGAGDGIAVSKLIYKIVLELKKNPSAPPDYHSLMVELEFLDRTFKLLQQNEPPPNTPRNRDAVQTLALLCHRPLEDFLVKIKKFEAHLGLGNLSRCPILGLPRRIQWSVLYKDDVKSLRDRLAPNMVIITILLTNQIIDTISHVEANRAKATQDIAYKLSLQRRTLRDMKRVIGNLVTARECLQTKQTPLTAAGITQNQDLHTIISKVDQILANDVAQKEQLRNLATLFREIQESSAAFSSWSQEVQALRTYEAEDTRSMAHFRAYSNKLSISCETLRLA